MTSIWGTEFRFSCDSVRWSRAVVGLFTLYWVQLMSLVLAAIKPEGPEANERSGGSRSEIIPYRGLLMEACVNYAESGSCEMISRHHCLWVFLSERYLLWTEEKPYNVVLGRSRGSEGQIGNDQEKDPEEGKISYMHRIFIVLTSDG